MNELLDKLRNQFRMSKCYFYMKIDKKEKKLKFINNHVGCWIIRGKIVRDTNFTRTQIDILVRPRLQAIRIMIRRARPV